MSVDASKLREGDVVLLRATVREDGIDGDGEVTVAIDGIDRPLKVIGVAPWTIVSIEPRPIAVGDRVDCAQVAWPAQVWALSPDGLNAWIGEVGGPRHVAVPLSTLTREEPSDGE